MGRLVAFIIVLVAWRAGSAATVSESVYLSGLGAEHPAVMALEGPLATARGQEQTSRALMNPTVEFDLEAPGDIEQTTFGVTWTPPLDGRRGLSKNAARAGVEVAQSALGWQLLELRAELREAYATWAIAAQRTSLIRSQIATFRAVVERAEERQRLGEESGLTAQRLALALVEIKASAARAEAELSEARSLALGRITASFEDPQPVLPVLPALPSEPDLGAHPLLAARRAEVQEAEARARLSHRFLLAPELRAGWQNIKAPNVTVDGPVVGIGWSVPLFDRRQGEGLEWEGRLRTARARLEWDERRVRATLSGALESYRQLREAALVTMQALEGSERIIEQVTARFQMGESDATDFLDAMRSVLSSRMTGLELYGAALQAHRRLELASGQASSEVQRGGR